MMQLGGVVVLLRHVTYMTDAYAELESSSYFPAAITEQRLYLRGNVYHNTGIHPACSCRDA